MTAAAPRTGPPLDRLLARRLSILALVVFGLNTLFIGIYYGSDRRALVAGAVGDQFALMEAALVGGALPADAPLRSFYAEHPQSYAFALVDRGGVVRDSMNATLIPPGATDIFADDWITALDRPEAPLVTAGHEFAGRDDGLRMVFVMQGDPARLVWRAYLAEFYEHVWIPILPLVVLLIGANTFLIRRSLAPVTAAAAWARNLRPGTPQPPPAADLPQEIADLVDATRRSVERLAQALQTEKRRAGEAAHALRTPVAALVARLDALPPGDTTDRLRGDLVTLSRTVQQVLSSSRAEALERVVPIDLRATAEAVVGALAPFAYQRGADLVLDAPDAPVMALADPEGAEVALTNLVENAILHGGAGQVDISVGPGPEIRVCDRGPGLPAGAEARMFDPFWRGPSAGPGGAGLGLAIVQRVQQAQGGSVAALRPADGGAAFVLGWKSPPA